MDAKTKTQSSRKGKKAWRKNIVVDDINQALEAKRERQVLHGDDDMNNDFVIDTQGSQAAKQSVTVLRTTDILTNKSKVPALKPQTKKQRVSKARASKLMVLAGRSLTQSKEKARLDVDGLVKGSNVDIWGESVPSESKQKQIPKFEGTVVSFTKASKRPATLEQAPLALHVEAPIDNVVHAGKSYNPSLESWQGLVNREFITENEKQMRIQELEQEKQRIQHLIDTMPEEELVEDESEEEREPENEEDKYKLSVNESVQVKRKTRTQRNRQARHKKRLELHDKIKDLKVQLRDLDNLKEIEQEVDAKASVVKPVKTKIYTRHSKHDPVFTPLEVKLSDELTNDLRRIKPEGNLVYEEMYKLQMSGKIEARVPVSRKSRNKKKISERHSYKSFK